MPLLVRFAALLVLTLALVPFTLHAQTVRVLASIDVAGPTTDDDVRYDLDVTGADVDAVGQPRLPDLTGLEPVVLAPVVTRLEGTGFTPRVRFRWTLRPTRAGQARIGAAYVPVKGQLVASNPLAFVVRPGANATGASVPGAPDPASPGAAPRRAAPRLAANDVFVRTRRVPAGRVWQGEQVVVEWQLYARPDLDLNYRIVDAGAAAGFWREDLPVDRAASPSIVRIGGRPYSTLVIRRVALFPQQAGALTVAPVRIEGTARVPIGAALFGLDAAPRIDEAFTRTSDALTVTTVERPAAPSGFSGLTGQADLRAAVASRRTRVGEGVDVTVTVTGDGALATLAPPRLDIAPDIADVYDARTDSTRRIAGSRYRGSRTFHFTVVPRRAGALDLPPVVLTRFDVRTRRYVREVTPLGRLEVIPGAARAARVATDSAGTADAPTRPEARRTAWLLAAMLIGLVVMGAGLVLLGRRRRTPAPPAPTRAAARPGEAASPGVRRSERSAAPVAPGPAAAPSIERQVLDALGTDAARRAADLARRHLAAAIARRLDRPVLPASSVALGRALADAGVSEAERDTLVDLLDRLSAVAYAPGTPDAATAGPLVRAALDRARQLAA